MEFNIDILYSFLLSAAPALAAIISIIVSVVKTIKMNKEIVKPVIEEFETLRKEVQDKTELEAVKNEMLAIMSENRQIRQEIADLITEMRKQKYEVPEK